MVLPLALACSTAGVMAADKQDAENSITPAGTAQAVKQIELEHQVQATENVIGKFKEMGVGVTPFELSLQNIKGMVSENRISDAKWQLDRLNYSLSDQQRRFYADKIQSWHTDRQRAIAERVRAFKAGNPGARLCQSARDTISKRKSLGTIIYPIAR